MWSLTAFRVAGIGDLRTSRRDFLNRNGFEQETTNNGGHMRWPIASDVPSQRVRAARNAHALSLSQTQFSFSQIKMAPLARVAQPPAPPAAAGGSGGRWRRQLAGRSRRGGY